MNGLPYYKRYPRDFFEGTIGMPLELKGPYSLIIDLIYMQNGNLPDDARYISGLLGCSLRQWTSLRERLLGMGKITKRDGYLTNYRADNELITSHLYQNKQRENGAKGGKIKGLRQAVAKPKPSQSESEPDKEKDTYVSLSDSAFDMFNEFALRAGWPSCQKRTKPRVSAINARIKEAGGLDGWRVALEKAEASDFLCNRTRATFTASIDFLLQASSFAKLMEGNYDNRTGNADGSGRNGSSAHDKLMAGFAAVADREQRKAGLDLFPSEGPEFPGEPDRDSWQGGRLA